MTQTPAFWPLDDAAGGPYRDTAGSHPLAGHGAPTPEAGAAGVTLSSGAVGLASASSQYLADGAGTLLPDFAGGFDLSFLLRLSAAFTGADTGLMGWYTGGPGPLVYYTAGRVNFIVNTGAGQVQVTADSFGPMAALEWYPVQAWYDPAGPTVGVSIAGVTDTLAVTAPLSNSGTFALGTFGGGHYLDGRVQAAGVSPLMTPTQRAARLLALRNFDVGDTRGLVNCGLNSLTLGTNASDPATRSYPALLQADLGAGWLVVNNGVGGRTGESAYAAVRAEDYAAYTPRRDANIYIYWEGVNSIAGGDTPAQAYASLTKYVAWVRGLGYRAAACTMLPVAGTTLAAHPTLNADGATYNGLVVGNAAAADLVVDFSDVPALADATSTTYFSATDGLHLTDAGYAAAEAYVLSRLRASGLVAPPPAARRLFLRTAAGTYAIGVAG